MKDRWINLENNQFQEEEVILMIYMKVNQIYKDEKINQLY